jgi:hypothetical protein
MNEIEPQSAGYKMAKQIEETLCLDDKSPNGFHADDILKDWHNGEAVNRGIISAANKTFEDDKSGLHLEMSPIFEGTDLRLSGRDGNLIDENRWGAFPEYNLKKTDPVADSAKQTADQIVKYFQDHGNSFNGFGPQLHQLDLELTKHYSRKTGNLDMSLAQLEAKDVSDLLKPNGINYQLIDKGRTMGNEYFAASLSDPKGIILTDNWEAPANSSMFTKQAS